MNFRRKLTIGALLTVAFVAAGPVLGALRAHAASNTQATTREFADDNCAACHGADGNSTIKQYPKLAGQTVAYLKAQLEAFRSGERKSEVMAPIAKKLTDTQIADLADFYASQSATSDTVTNRTLADQGERIFFSPGRGVPACSSCHSAGLRGPTGMSGSQGMSGGMMGGMNGMRGMTGGMMSSSAPVPNLSGQHAAYLTAQLAAFADGSRSGTVMNRVAAPLSEDNREALAQYLSGLR